MSDNWNAKGPVVVWHHYGCEGWSPRSYPTFLEAIGAGIEGGDVLTLVVPLSQIINSASTPEAVATYRSALGLEPT